MKLSKLKMNPNNPRKIAPHALQKLMDSIERDPDFMVLRPMVYDPETMHVLGGNQRLAALRKLGHKDIPDQWAVPAEDLTPEQKRRFVLADNGQFGEWDFDILSAEWGDLELADWGIDLPDFKSDFTSVGIAGAAPEDATSGLASKWGVQKGQVWQCGDSRIMCGDSTIKDDVDKLLAGAKPELMVTDPPYGVEYDASWRNEEGLSTGRRAIAKVNNDDRVDWLPAWELSPASVCYVYHAGAKSPVVHDSLVKAKYELINLIIWNKNNIVIGRGNYHHKHEPIWYMAKKGSKHHWAGSRKESTVWDIDKNMANKTGHSTEKPLECMQRPIRNHTCKEVYDPFLGSGTTLMAAFNEQRICYGMEINPDYVAVALQRFLDATGIQPELIND